MSDQPMLITTASEARWQEGMRSSVTMRNFAPVLMDEPPQLGGTDQGPNPMEYVMGALNGCVAVMVNLIAGEMGFRFQGMQLKSSGDIDLRGLLGVAGVSPHFQKAELLVELRTAEPAERVQELAEKVQARCPAINLLRDAGVPLETRFVMVG